MKESDEDAALLHLYNPFIIKKSFSDRKKSVQVKNDPRHSLSLSGPPGSGSLIEKTNDWNSFRKNRPLLCLTFHLESCVGNVQLSSERDFFNGSSIINRFMGEMRRREGKGSVTTHFVCRPIFETILRYLSNAEYMSTSSRKIDVSITSKRQKCWPRNSKESNLIKTGMTFSLN